MGMTVPKPNPAESASGGLVEIDPVSLSALEEVTAVGPLTNSELRAAPPEVLNVSQLVPAEYDSIELIPPAKPTVIRYYVGGLSGTLVATLTLSYDGDDVSTVSRA